MSIIGANAKLSKQINRELVLKIIYNRRPISRANIANITGLTPASISKIIDEFIDIGLVYEIRKDVSNYGRKPVLIDINSESYHIVGIYIARKSISGIITNLNADIKKKIIYEKSKLSDKKLLDNVNDLISKLLDSSKTDKNKILGIGMAVPGPINANKGEILNSEISEEPPYNWKKVPLTESVSKKFGLPVFADNCSNTSALGESWFGNGMNYKNFVLFSFGEGVGSGLILKNRLYRGEDDIIGEIGHTTIYADGPRCECGNYGCMELYVKNHTILKKYNELAKKYPNSKLAKSNIKKIEDIYNFSEESDPIYIEIIDHLTKYLGIGTVNLINTLNPEAVIIGTNEIGDIKMDAVINKIRKIVKNRAYSVVRDKVRIIPSKLGNNAQLVGSICLVLRDFFKLESYRSLHSLKERQAI